MHTGTPSRTRHSGKIAAFLDARTVVISRGEREGVELGDYYVILNNDVDGDWVALLRVFEVREKMALAKSIWALPRAPILKIGWNVFRVDWSGKMPASAKEANAQIQVKETVSLPPIRVILRELHRIAAGDCACVGASPYVVCKSCRAADAIGDAAEMLRDAWRELQRGEGERLA